MEGRTLPTRSNRGTTMAHMHTRPHPRCEGRCRAEEKLLGETHACLVAGRYKNFKCVHGRFPPGSPENLQARASTLSSRSGFRRMWHEGHLVKTRMGAQSAPCVLAPQAAQPSHPMALPLHPQHQWGWVGVGKHLLCFKENIRKRVSPLKNN